MGFGSPMWLLALAPWAALVIWLLTGRRPRMAVPFLALWPKDQPPPAKRRRLRSPPLPVVAAILAALAAILSAAQIRWTAGSSSAGPDLCVIVDRGLSMSADVDGKPRFLSIAAELAQRLPAPTRVDLRTIPDAGQRHTTIGDFAAALQSLAPTAIPTADALKIAAAERLANSAGPVIVLSDQPLAIDNPRLITIAPPPIENAGIVRLTARTTPPALMVRVRNDSARQTATLTIHASPEPITHKIDLPPRGQERNYFFAAPPLGDSLMVELTPGDAISADDRAFLVRQRRFPKLEPSPDLPPELAWMAQVYAAQHPPGRDSLPIAIARHLDQLPRYQAGVAFPGGGGPAASTQPASLRVIDHPITRTVQWSSVLRAPSVSPPPGDGWTPLLQLGDRPAVALRTEPVRQVWVGFDSEDFPRSADWVVFWKNVFDWLGADPADPDAAPFDEFTASPVAALGPQWRPITPATRDTPPGLWPGIWQDAQNHRRALNTAAQPLPTPPATDWSRLQNLAATQKPGQDLSAPAALVAVLLACAAAISWPRRDRAVIRDQ